MNCELGRRQRLLTKKMLGKTTLLLGVEIQHHRYLACLANSFNGTALFAAALTSWTDAHSRAILSQGLFTKRSRNAVWPGRVRGVVAELRRPSNIPRTVVLRCFHC